MAWLIGRILQPVGSPTSLDRLTLETFLVQIFTELLEVAKF